MQTCIYTEGPYQVYLEHEPTEEMIALLESTNWGTGKTVYQHFNNRAHFLHIPEPNIFTVREAGQLRAFTVFAQRTVPDFPNDGKSYYIRFFCAVPEIKGAGIVKNLSAIVMEYIRKQEGQVCFYATIEARNPAVQKITQRIGFEILTTIKTLGFSRFFPTAKLSVHPLSAQAFEAFQPILDQSKATHSFWVKDNLQITPGYFVHEQGGEIVVGAQVHLAHWAIRKLPGLGGKLLPILPHIPLLNRIFNPKAFHFLTFEGFFVKPGFEGLLPDFLESLLYHFDQHAALFWLEERDPLYPIFKSTSLGFMHHFVKHSNASFVASFNEYPAELKAHILQKPLYVSSFDNI